MVKRHYDKVDSVEIWLGIYINNNNNNRNMHDMYADYITDMVSYWHDNYYNIYDIDLCIEDEFIDIMRDECGL